MTTLLHFATYLTLVCLCGRVSSLKCYRCASGTDGNCATERLYEGQLKECNPATVRMSRCLKTVTSDSGKITRIQRDCDFRESDGCKTVNGVKTCNTSCRGDGCNTGTPMRPRFLLLTLLASIVAKVLH